MTPPDKQTDPARPAVEPGATGTDDERPADTGASQAEGGSQAVTEAALFEAFGGVRGLIETTVPGLVFIAMFTVNKDLHTAAITALVISGVMVVVRLLRKDTVKHAFSGIFGVGFGVLFAMMTGNAKDFYLPGMLYTLGLALGYIVTSLAGVPLLGLVLGPVFKENLSWRKRNPGRKKAYTKASYAWGFILLGKSAVLFPLYFWGDTTQFGWVTVVLKIPPFLLAVYLTWIFLAKAPPPINVIAEMEAEDEAAKAEKAAAKAATAEAGTPGRHRR
ncbi:DUF3159 domain-containing protein [Streptomyces reniochalinae]|uniref:DUF3159 domain-containing protein n=1 Tax=Streptomyces reniochalinae TaxID=2250578 RepID=A0A367E7E9_9ACTN|nr:DUF3159 domain-containing protein [Streptomyces reniochalinae]RCG13327.1 DUF3159 domain-containing protein [Streptomyces reniochalinae]